MISVKEMIAVMQAYDGGSRLQARTRGTDSVWFDVHAPSFDWLSKEYRVKPIVHDSFDWGALNERFKFIARDEDGNAFAFTAEPTTKDNQWWSSNFEMLRISSVFTSYENNGANWKDSMIERPSSATNSNAA